MDRIKRYLRKNSGQTELIILLTGIIIALYYRGSSTLSSIGASMIASAIVVFMTDVLVGGNENEGVKRWGLEAVYHTRGVMNNSCDSYLEKAKKVDVIAFGLQSWRDSQQKQIDRILENGGIIRIITMKPECDNLKARERDEHSLEKQISHSIINLLDWAKTENSKGYRGKVEIRYHDHLPLDFLFLMDNRLFTGPYEYGKSSQQTLSFEYNCSGEAYRYYEEYFNGLWNDKEFCSDAI